MFKHPLNWIGGGLIVVGWIWLINGSGVDTGVLARPVINIHKVTMAQMTIVTGLALFIAGIIADAVKDVTSKLARISESVDRTTDAPKGFPRMPDLTESPFDRDPEAAHLKGEMQRKLQEKGLR